MPVTSFPAPPLCNHAVSQMVKKYHGGTLGIAISALSILPFLKIAFHHLIMPTQMWRLTFSNYSSAIYQQPPSL